jgi:NTP pyrophosphatase (non-canonical NTP hydrolase)
MNYQPKFASYVQWLCEINARKVTEVFRNHASGAETFAAFCFGLAEEVQEVLEAWDTNPNSRELLLEQGDVVAYAVLIARCFTNDLANVEESVLKPIGYIGSIDQLLLSYNGLLKRHYREDYSLFTNPDKQLEFITVVRCLVSYVLASNSNNDLETITEANRIKLTARLRETK